MLKSIFQSNRNQLLVFSITFFIFSFFVFYNISSFDEAKKTKPDLTSVINLVHGDEPHYLSVTSDIIRQHSVFLENYFHEENRDPNLTWPEKYYDTPTMWEASQRSDGHYISLLGPGLSYIMIIPYALGGITGSMLTMNVISSLTCLFIYSFVTRFTTKRIGFIVSLIFGLSTLLLIYSNYIYDDVLFTMFLVASVYFILEKHDRSFYMSITGVFLGYVLFLKVSYVLIDIILISVIIFLLLKKRITLRNFLFFIGFFSFLAVMSVVNNLYTYDSWLGGAYTTSALGLLSGGNLHGNLFADQGENQYRITSLIEAFFGKFHGLFIFSPVSALFVIGILPMWKQHRFHFIIISILSVVIVSEYVWTIPLSSISGGDPPFRYFLPILPLLSIPFSIGLHKFSKKWMYRIIFALLFMTSLTLSIIFTLIRVGSLSHSQLKAQLLHSVYRGTEILFPSLGPTKIGLTEIPVHHPLDNYNIIFLIFAVSSLLAGTIIPSLTIIKIKNLFRKK